MGHTVQTSQKKLYGDLEGQRPSSSSGQTDLIERHKISDSKRVTDRRNSVVTQLMGVTRKQIVILGLYGLANVFRAAVVLIGGPLFPQEANRKGALGTEIGIIFAAQDFTVFLLSFLYGKKILNQIGPQRVVTLSFFGIGICAILFGCTVLIEDRTLFVTTAILVKILNGICDCGIYPAVFTIFSIEIPGAISTSIAIFETFFGIGAILGPILGAILYEKVGFTWTYAIIGSLIIFSAVVILLFVPKIKKSANDEDESDSGDNAGRSSKSPIHHPGFFRLLTIPTVLLVILSLSTTAASIGFITATLSLHYSFLSPSASGGLFSTGTALYTVACPIWGYVADRRIVAKSNIMIGASFLIIVGYAFLGPLPFLPYTASAWTGFVGYAMVSMGIGGAVMTAYHHALEAAVVEGFPNDAITYGLVSSLYIATFSFGNTVGPTVSGILYDLVGFPWGTMFIIGLATVVIIASISLKFFNIMKRIEAM